MSAPEPAPFEIGGEGPKLLGETLGEGPPVVLLHGITASRRYVLHGSKALARGGYGQISYDARCHGESDPAPGGEPYDYAALREDLGRVLAERVDGTPVLVGDSMGTHTAAAYALEHAGEVAGLVLSRPTVIGIPPADESLERWDSLADGLERAGVDGFMEAYERGMGDVDRDWRGRILGFTRERMELHKHPHELARAVREIPRSLPFEGMEELESLDVPALVVGSQDDADPGHPYAVAEMWAERLPDATFVSEERGESPLSWRGGKLAREIAAFAERTDVRERLAGH